jgi:acetyltransferase
MSHSGPAGRNNVSVSDDRSRVTTATALLSGLVETPLTPLRLFPSVTITDLFEPGAIAVVGASRTPGKLGNDAMRNASGYDGPVYPVNPSGEGELFGEPFHESVAAIDDQIDLALLCVPPQVVPDVLEDCGDAGVGAAVIYSGGFAEAGEEGRRLQDAITDIAAEQELTLLGPNVSGFVLPGDGLCASFVPGIDEIGAGDVAIVAQSGGVAHALAFQSDREGRGVAAMVGLGNRANTGFEEVIDYLDDRSDVGSIVLHVEGTDDARGLLETCRATETPIVAYKVGKEDVGGFAQSHTGALTGDHALYEGGFRQYGVPTVDSTTELLDAGHALARSPEPGGPNVGVITAQAGPGIIVSDRLQGAGATLPELSDQTRETVEEILPGITYSANPVDSGRPMPEFGDLVAAVARDENVDVVLVYMLFEESLGFPVEDLDGLDADVEKPILFATDGLEADMAASLEALADAGVPTFRTPERGADAAASLVEYARVSEGVAVSPDAEANADSEDAGNGDATGTAAGGDRR